MLLGTSGGGIVLAKPSAALLLALPLAVLFFAAPNRRQPGPLCCPLALPSSSMPWLLDNTLSVGSPFSHC